MHYASRPVRMDGGTTSYFDGYCCQHSQLLGPGKDIPAPDVYTTDRIMDWMRDEYEVIKGGKHPDVITSMPICLGGSEGRFEATAREAFYCINFLCTKEGKLSEDLTAAIQGFGEAGYHLARLLSEAGYKIVAVSDSKGGIYCAAGLDVQMIHECKHNTNHSQANYPQKSVISCEDCEGYELINNKDLLELNVDIFAPAALENAITTDNTEEIKAKWIIEVANGPVSTEADEFLFDRGVDVISDVLANSGGVIVSYFEWVQNRSGYPWTLEEVQTRLKEKIENTFETMWQYEHKEETTSLR